MLRACLLLLFAASLFGAIGCGGGNCNSSSSTSTKSCTTTNTVTIVLSPSTTTNVPLGGTLQFTANVSGDSNTALTWQVNGQTGGNSTVGTISSSGLYTTPATVPNPATVTVTAISQANTNDEANVSLVIVSGVTVAVSPATVNLLPGKQQQFTATVSGNSNANVSWSVAGVAGGNSTVGTITAQGLYTAPSSPATAPTSVTVSATAAVDATKTAQASVTLHKNLSVALSPASASVQTFGQQWFTGSVSGDSNATFTWQVNGISGGDTTFGTIVDAVDASGVHHGLYTAPNHVPTTPAVSGTNVAAGGAKTTPVTVTAVYQADSYFSASGTLTVTSPNQKTQSLPMPLGVSGGNVNDSDASTCCGGTLGALVSRGGQQYILSTSHVLARTDMGTVGDSIIQPGLLDASCSTSGTNAVAAVSQFVNLETYSGPTPIDAALALVSPGKVDPLGTILQLGAITNSGQPTNGPPHAGSGVPPSLYEPDGVTPLKVAKSGRATGLTCSSISAINVTASVTFQKGCSGGAQFQQTYTDLVVVEGGDFSAQGDSGALIVTQDTADPVALLFASSDTASLGSPISDVLSALADPNTGEKPVFVGSATAHSVAACSLPGAQVASAKVHGIGPSPSSSDLARATRVRDAHAPFLLGRPEVAAVGVGGSLDSPGQPAILVFVNYAVARNPIPQELDGIRIRLLKAPENLPIRRALSGPESQRLAEVENDRINVRALSPRELARARSVHSSRVSDLMHLSGVQGVGVSASADAPGEAALLFYVVRGATHAAIPSIVDGVRTVIRESRPFESGFGTVTSGAGCSATLNARPSGMQGPAPGERQVR